MLSGMERLRICVNCGRPLVNRGRAAKQCGECERGRRRIKERVATCIQCGQTFTPAGQTGMLPKRCQSCNDVYMRARGSNRQKEWRDANPDRAKEHWNKYNRKRLADPEFRKSKRDAALLRNHGIDRAQFDALLAAQNGVCLICGGGPNGPGDRLHVDHCHNSKRIRGLLCAKCNTAVGLLDNDPDRAEVLAKYLRQ